MDPLSALIATLIVVPTVIMFGAVCVYAMLAMRKAPRWAHLVLFAFSGGLFLWLVSDIHNVLPQGQSIHFLAGLFVIVGFEMLLLIMFASGLFGIACLNIDGTDLKKEKSVSVSENS